MSLFLSFVFDLVIIILLDRSGPLITWIKCFKGDKYLLGHVGHVGQSGHGGTGGQSQFVCNPKIARTDQG